MLWILADRHAARRRADDLGIEAVGPALALGDELRLERGRSIARHIRNLHRNEKIDRTTT